MALLQTGIAKSTAEDYTIDQSLRFDDGDSAYLSRTPGSAGNRQIWTFSAWVKRGTQGSEVLFHAGTSLTGNSGYFDINFQSDGTLKMTTGSTPILITDAVYRDSSAWYHVVAVNDSGTFHFYVNGVEPSYSTNVGLSGTDTAINNTVITHVGVRSYVSGSTYTDQFFDGYLAEVHFIDGTALDADSFGETDSTTNQWKPIEYDGSYGTNGFYQKYASTELADSFEDRDSTHAGQHTVTANGNVHTDTSVKKIGTASAQFDGTGDYLSVADSTDWDFGVEDFTIEFWVRLDTVGASQEFISQYVDSSNRWIWMFHSGVGSYFETAGGTGGITVSQGDTTGWAIDTWYHMAIVRNGSSWVMYKDGTSIATATDSDSLPTLSSAVEIGRRSDATNYIQGYMDEIRISKTAVYTAAFTPSTTAFYADSNTLLLLHCDGADSGTSFPDSSPHKITANGHVANTRAQQKVGDSSIVFDGTGDYLSVDSSSNLKLGSTSDSWTIEFWVYLNDVSSDYITMDHRANTMANGGWSFYSDVSEGGMGLGISDGSSWTTGLQDPTQNVTGQWYHYAVVQVGDTSLKMYADGTEVDTTATLMTDASGTYINWFIGGGYNNGGSHSDNYYLNGYLDEIRVSDVARYTGAFTPSTTEFTTDANTLLLIHSNWGGTLGADSSGNYNTFTVTNLVATDQMEDSPTNNFATFNPLIYNPDASGCTFSEGNLKASISDGSYTSVAAGTIYGSGKFYCEFYIGANTNAVGGGGYPIIGVISSDYSATTIAEAGQTQVDTYWYYKTGQKIGDGGSAASYGDTWTTGDIIGVALDLDNGGNLYFSKNGTWQDSGDPTSGGTATGAAFTGLSGTFTGLSQMFGNGSAQVVLGNFGSDSSFAGTVTAQGNQDDNEIGDFYYEPPSGFLALCTSNLSAPEIADPTDHFNTVLFTGNASADKAVTGVGFAPDLGWFKSRTSTDNNVWYDSVRGVSKALRSSTTGPETTTSGVTAFDSDGYTLGDNTMSNYSGAMVSWNWKGDGVAGGTLNQDGDIDSYVNVNTTAGFSIVKYTGNGTGGDTVGHGLAQTPEHIILKRRDGDGWSWYGYNEATGNTRSVYLNATNNYDTDSTFWNDTSPTASVFTVGTANGINQDTGTYIAYCFHSVEGYSKVGSYEGNGDADGVFVYTGFKPAWVMIKRYDASGQDWRIQNTACDPYNVMSEHLRANTNGAETTSGDDFGDYLSNGFKARTTSGGWNASGGDYLYIAFAETPFKTANAR